MHGRVLASDASQHLHVRQPAATQLTQPRPRQTLTVSRSGLERGEAASLPAPWRRWALAACAAAQLAVGHLALPPVALANTADFTLDVRPSENEPEEQYFQTAPQSLSSADSAPKGPRLGSLLEGPKGKEVQQCTRKCVPTCIRGGQGAPGLGPMSVRKEVVVFKEGYRTRTYCLSECIQVCSLTINPAVPAPK